MTSALPSSLSAATDFTVRYIGALPCLQSTAHGEAFGKLPHASPWPLLAFLQSKTIAESPEIRGFCRFPARTGQAGVLHRAEHCLCLSARRRTASRDRSAQFC